jgi:hypothetical protein
MQAVSQVFIMCGFFEHKVDATAPFLYRDK